MPGIFLAYETLNGRSGHAVGRQLLAKLYDTHVGGQLPEIRIAPMGKPYFPDAPWHFSISHCKNHVFCVLADRPVGVDAEELSRRVAPTLAQKILSPEELAQYAAVEDPNRAALTFWVLKEAVAKWTGAGIRVPVNDTKFSLTDQRVQEIDGCIVAIVQGEEGGNHVI